MKIVSIIAVLLAIAFGVQSSRKLGGPVGTCPLIDGHVPVYLLDLLNRTVFYECSNSRPVLHRCSPGLAYNPISKTCDFPRIHCGPQGAVGQCPAEEKEDLVYLRDGLDMALYYRCRNGTAELLRCDYDQIYEPFRMVCVSHPYSNGTNWH